MNGVATALTIISTIVLAFVLWKIIKPYIIRYDTTLLFTGGLGSGKTSNSVIQTIICIRKNRFFHYYMPIFLHKIATPLRKLHNKRRVKRFWKCRKGSCLYLPLYKKPKKPLVYSNIPVTFRTHLFGFKREWATVLDEEHILLLKEINEYSVVFIDEFPQFISQFDWDIELVQKNCNEFITYFRHYIGGNLIINAQSEDEIECHFRRKLNIGIWCFNFKVWPLPFLPIFYTCRMCDFMLSDNITTMSTTYIEENTRWRFGFFPRGAFNSRCYSPRYKRVHTKLVSTKKWQQLKTTKVLRLRKYVSPLDDKTTPNQINDMLKEADRLKRSDE